MSEKTQGTIDEELLRIENLLSEIISQEEKFNVHYDSVDFNIKCRECGYKWTIKTWKGVDFDHIPNHWYRCPNGCN